MLTSKSIEEIVVNLLKDYFKDSQINWGLETDMDDVSDWDSLSYFDIVNQLEDKFSISFDEEEITQLFKVSHIARIIRFKIFNIPHDDVSHAMCQMKKCINNSSKYDVLLISGSSTREAMLKIDECEKILNESKSINKGRWFNLSVSGLVLAETYTILNEVISSGYKGSIVLGISPIIYAGCGVAEFERSANYSRFPFYSKFQEDIFKNTQYSKNKIDKPIFWKVSEWVDHYLDQKKIDELIYNPYLYPNLDRWNKTKFEDFESILRYYNNSFLNHEESCELNYKFLKGIIELCRKNLTNLFFCELTLHTEVYKLLEELGNLTTEYNKLVSELTAEFNIPYINPSKIISLTDDDFRDPGHIYRRKEQYTRSLLEKLKINN